MSDVTELLTKAQKVRDDGIITEAELKKLKKDILEGKHAPAPAAANQGGIHTLEDPQVATKREFRGQVDAATKGADGPVLKGWLYRKTVGTKSFSDPVLAREFKRLTSARTSDTTLWAAFSKSKVEQGTTPELLRGDTEQHKVLKARAMEWLLEIAVEVTI
jgi:hypothetical protein